VSNDISGTAINGNAISFSTLIGSSIQVSSISTSAISTSFLSAPYFLGSTMTLNSLVSNSTINVSTLTSINLYYTNLIITTLSPVGIFFSDNSAIVTGTPSLDFDTFGQTWGPTTSSALNWASISISFNGEFQVACVEGGSIWYSSNYGKTWIVSNAIIGLWKYITLSGSGQYATACINGGSIWYSADYGHTWVIASGTANTSWYAVYMTGSGIFQTACVFNGGLWYSSDYGHTWTQSDAPPILIWTGVALSASGAFQTACATAGGIYYSSNFGLNWIHATSNSISIYAMYNIESIYFTSIACSASGQYQSATVGFDVGGLWHSIDFGHSWTRSIDIPYMQSVSISATGQYMSACIGNGSTGVIWTAVVSLPSITTINGSIGIGVANPTYKLQLATDSAAKPGTNTWTILSDERIKTDISLADTARCYDAVKTIPLKVYTWRDEVYTTEQVRDRTKLGWIAQDVEKVFPKSVSENRFVYNGRYVPSTMAIRTIVDGVVESVISTVSVYVEDVIEDCKDLDTDQMYAVMYGALSKVIDNSEQMQSMITNQQSSIQGLFTIVEQQQSTLSGIDYSSLMK